MTRNAVTASGAGTLAVEPGRRPLLDLGDARDCRIVADALRVLLRERSEALAFAMRVADEHGRPRPEAGEFGLTDIIRLARVVERADRQR
ncbi:hypothetical protein P350_34305 [Burkholderia cepacia JBK9]|uniref:hypothetical protein n=1 Tax=Burkholderia arboris TaxID=488730 RepID=UPI00074096F4|nr:hypothetical protein [Burkholderia arboris]ALX16723.1 hypothetical protein P350_34305 [Burkholderia cepacia JBK9]MCA8489422.1 hypothetical protein [Burkholderia arboris]